jgi:hypothetical protein
MSRSRSYLSSDAIEVEEIEGYSGTRRSVLLDEVSMLTLDRRVSLWRVVLWGVLGVLCLVPLVAMDTVTAPEFVAFSLIAAFPLGLAVLYGVMGFDVVTVFGKRGVAQVRFFVRKRRARQVFEMVREAVERAQGVARPAAAPAEPGSSAARLPSAPSPV